MTSSLVSYALIRAGASPFCKPAKGEVQYDKFGQSE
jgi:hypothetical protein